MSSLPLTIRPATDDDVPALTDLYNHYILNSPATFHLEPLTVEQRREWASHYADHGRYRLLVAEREGALLGYATSSPFHERLAYQTSIECSVYIHQDAVGQGVGSRLYTALFDILAREPIHRAYAGITMPNDASVGLHRRFGFRDAGLYTEVGYKFGRYWDVAWLQKDMPN
ncbi:MAG: N-acetyltransferase [Chloroflexi bacterium]|nr:N-acetyltransferase [Chloroflexota bacterium]